MDRIQAALKNNAFVPYAIYLISLMLFGMWSMMHYIHWALPIVLVTLAACTQQPVLVAFNMAAAAVMAVYGFATWQHLSWYVALAIMLAPLVALLVITPRSRGKDS